MKRFLLACALLGAVSLLGGCGPEQLPGDYRLPDGSVYEGGLRDDRFHGEGKLTWPDGRVYQGQFVDGVIQGQGRYQYADGCVHEGAFENGLANGEGRYACDDGTVYEGTFAAGDPLRGKATFPEAGWYEGEFQDWQPQGQGTWTSEGGDVYSGTFKNGEIVKGRYHNDSGLTYEGGFQGWLFHGQGTLTRPDGEVRKGRFQYGSVRGPGQRITLDQDGEQVSERGFFIHGDFFQDENGYQDRRRRRAERVEQRLYSEERRLQRAFTALVPQKAGQRDVYVLVVGGDGRQGVFAREARWVAERLGGHWSPRGHHLVLANGEHGDAPLATLTSLHESLRTLGSILDPEEDLLFVHLVSHGGSDGNLVLAQPGLALNDLTPARFDEWLDEAGIGYLWLVVSACYSGQWVDPLAERRRVIFTAAAADRTSFGCSDDSDRTWFSEALYGDALDNPGPDDPKALFKAARARVDTMETEQGIDEEQRSLPRAWFGQAFLGWW
ncbi:C13 family peptidase [Alloalcanivorax sp. C16-2]|uniref:C13 family peptidase n=1 Tax=Alloalcanivorax sp. C16-2 TaxID=3390052 RepID=UPI00397110F7